MPGRKGSIARRSLAWLWFHVVAVILGRLLRPRPQIIIVPSPLLSVAVVAWLINLGRQAQYIYNVQELYPDLAINSGHLRNTWFIRLLRGLESFVYDRAAAVTTIGATMRERIASRAPGRQVRLIPNAADIDSMRPLPRDNDFARQHGLTDRIVVTYAGNMGLMQGLEDVLRAAKLAEAEAITFLFVGDGVVAANLRESARAQGLGNVKFLPQQPYVMVPQIYAASDVCLVPLIGAIASEAVPSKVARIMACARPALVIAPPESDLARLVRATGCGVVAAPGRPEDIARKVSDLAADAALRREMGERGRSHAIAHFSRAAVGNAYDELIRSLA